MANTIILKKSSVAGKVPLAADLQPGELAVNLADGKLFTKTGGGAVLDLFYTKAEVDAAIAAAIQSFRQNQYTSS